MKIFVAGCPYERGSVAYTMQREVGMQLMGVKHRLFTYAYRRHLPLLVDLWTREPRGDREIMLDSGAYSAWTRGVEIDLQEYANFILKYPKAFHVVASLDVIPGRRGDGRPTAKEVERAAEQGWENWKELSRLLKPAGITPIHTYHYGEDIKWLKRIVDESEHLGIGGAARGKTRWLDTIMPYLTDDQGWPIRKFHGFAATSLDIMERYPWYSVDSTTWSMGGRRGVCYIPVNGKVLTVSFSRRGR